MTEVSTFRLYLMRVFYLLFSVGLGSAIWPAMIHHATPWDSMHGQVNCLLAALSVFLALGIRYPLQLLPVLLFELVWKSIWLVAIALPLWSAHQLDADALKTLSIFLRTVVICLIVVPWPYVLANYVRAPGDRWRRVAKSGAKPVTRRTLDEGIV
jgi:hypothetical protein